MMPYEVPNHHGLWAHTLTTRGEVAYVNAQRNWYRFEGPLPWRVGDLVRLAKRDMDALIAGARLLDNLPPPTILDLRRQLQPMAKIYHVVEAKRLP